MKHYLVENEPYMQLHKKEHMCIRDDKPFFSISPLEAISPKINSSISKSALGNEQYGDAHFGIWERKKNRQTLWAQWRINWQGTKEAPDL